MELKSVRFFVDFPVESRLEALLLLNHIKIVEIKSTMFVEELLNLLELDAVFLEQLANDKVHVGTAHDEAKHNPDQQP